MLLKVITSKTKLDFCLNPLLFLFEGNVIHPIPVKSVTLAYLVISCNLKIRIFYFCIFALVKFLSVSKHGRIWCVCSCLLPVPAFAKVSLSYWYPSSPESMPCASSSCLVLGHPEPFLVVASVPQLALVLSSLRAALLRSPTRRSPGFTAREQPRLQELEKARTQHRRPGEAMNK